MDTEPTDECVVPVRRRHVLPHANATRRTHPLPPQFERSVSHAYGDRSAFSSSSRRFRPAGTVVFHLDFEAGLYERRAEAAVDRIESVVEGGWVRRLGSYDVEHVVE